MDGGPCKNNPEIEEFLQEWGKLGEKEFFAEAFSDYVRGTNPSGGIMTHGGTK